MIRRNIFHQVVILALCIFSLSACKNNGMRKGGETPGLEGNDMSASEGTRHNGEELDDRLSMALGGDSTYNGIRNEAYPEYFAGRYFDGEGRLVILVFGDSAAARKELIKLLGRDDFLIGHITGGNSKKDLKPIKDKLRECINKAANRLSRNITSVGLNTINHTIDIDLIVNSPETQAEFRREIMDSPHFYFVPNTYPVPPQVCINDTSGIVLRTEYPVYHTSTQKIKYFLYNRGTRMLDFGEYSFVAYKEDGCWKYLPQNMNRVDIGHIINPNANFTFTQDLYPDLHPNRPGRYRVFQEVNPWGRNNIAVAAEFRLSDDWEECRKAGKNPIPDEVMVTEVQSAIPFPPVDENRIYDVAESMPEFPGGIPALLKFVNGRTAEVATDEYQGRVVVKFVVGKDGALTDAQIVRSCGEYMDKEALRIVGEMPGWKPGIEQGKKVKVRYTLPITFRVGSHP